MTSVAIQRTGLVTSVGLSAPATCAAIRAGLTNPSETRFIDSAGELIMAHDVPLDTPWRGRAKLVQMAKLAIAECLEEVAPEHWREIPLLLCVAEHDRPGRLEGLDDRLLMEVEEALDAKFASGSATVPHGRVSAAIALARARQLIHERNLKNVLVAATDSLLNWPTLGHYDRNDRLLTARNSNGFMPGEGACALLVGRPSRRRELHCRGIGFGIETAHIDSGRPLRAEGLTAAIKNALRDAQCEMHHLDFRITDVSGEHYYFKEAGLALLHTLHVRKESFDIWHPAECTGEAGALSGASPIAIAEAACLKGYAPGTNVLVHMANDSGQRSAAVLMLGKPI